MYILFSNQVEFDPASMMVVSNGVQFTKVFVTYVEKGRQIKYTSSARVNMADTHTTAKTIVQEIFKMYLP